MSARPFSSLTFFFRWPLPGFRLLDFFCPVLYFGLFMDDISSSFVFSSPFFLLLFFLAFPPPHNLWITFSPPLTFLRASGVTASALVFLRKKVCPWIDSPLSYPARATTTYTITSLLHPISSFILLNHHLRLLH